MSGVNAALAAMRAASVEQVHVEAVGRCAAERLELVEALRSIAGHDAEYRDVEDADMMVIRIIEKARAALAKVNA